MLNSTSSIPETQQYVPNKLKLYRVLVVDDVALNREILITQLGDAVLHVDEAADGRAALTRFKLCCYDAILLDIEMPGLDGYGTLKELRTWERERQLPLTPVVAITSSDFPEDEQRIMDAGASAYLVKPVKPKELMTALQLHCIDGQTLHPMESLLPRFFTSAGAMLEELSELKDLEAISKKLHQLRGMIAVYGFLEFAELLKQMHLRVKQGEKPRSAEFEQLRIELQRLNVTPSNLT